LRKLLLSRKPLAPASSARRTWASPPKVVSMTTRAAGNWLRIACNASMPHMPGMARSMMARSGRNAAQAASAWWPSPASPATCMSGWLAMASARPARSMGWSSTSSTRIGAAVSG